MNSGKEEIKSSTPISKQYDHDKLLDALYLIRLYLDAALIPFFLDKSTLYSVMNNKALQGSISLGIRSEEATEDALSILYDQEKPIEIKDNMIYFKIEDMPVNIKIYDSKSSMIKNTDTIFWGYETWQIPNPYKEFWEVRNELK